MEFNINNSSNFKPWYKRLYDFYVKVSAWFLTIRLVSVPVFILVYTSGKFKLVGYGLEDTGLVFLLVALLTFLSFLKEVLDVIVGHEFTDRFWIPVYAIRFLASFAIGTFLLFIPKIIFCYYHYLDYVTLGLGFVLVICWTEEDFYRRIVDQLALYGFDPKLVPPSARRVIVENSRSMDELAHNLNNFLTRKTVPFEPRSKFSLADFIIAHPGQSLAMTGAAILAVGATIVGFSYFLNRFENIKKGSVVYYVQAHEDVKTDTVLNSLNLPLSQNMIAGSSLNRVVQNDFKGPEARFFINSLFAPGDPRYSYLDYDHVTQFPAQGFTRVYYTPCSKEVLYQVPVSYINLLRSSEASATSLSKELLPVESFYRKSSLYTTSLDDMEGFMNFNYAYIESANDLKFALSTDLRSGCYSGFFAPQFNFYGPIDNLSPEKLTFLLRYFPRDRSSTFKSFSDIPQKLQAKFRSGIPDALLSKGFSLDTLNKPISAGITINTDLFSDDTVVKDFTFSSVTSNIKLNSELVRCTNITKKFSDFLVP